VIPLPRHKTIFAAMFLYVYNHTLLYFIIMNVVETIYRGSRVTFVFLGE